MQFLKKHYEKIVLSVVLLGLAVAAAALPYLVSQVQDQIENTVSSVKRSKPKPWPSLDLSTNEMAVSRLEGPIDVQLVGAHNLFNPVRWMKSSDGRVRKITTGREIGAGAVEVMKITPLELTVTFDGVSGSGDRIQYTVGIVRDTEAAARKTSGSAAVGVRNAMFRIEKVIGSPESPDALLVMVKDDKELITVSKDKPYKRVIGYVADLIYPPEKQTFLRRKVTSSLSLQGDESYKIVAITEHEVVLSSESTGKRSTIKLSASSASTR
jgi:hypothetical protein